MSKCKHDWHNPWSGGQCSKEARGGYCTTTGAHVTMICRKCRAKRVQCPMARTRIVTVED